MKQEGVGENFGLLFNHDKTAQPVSEVIEKVVTVTALPASTAVSANL